MLWRKRTSVRELSFWNYEAVSAVLKGGAEDTLTSFISNVRLGRSVLPSRRAKGIRLSFRKSDNMSSILDRY